MTGANWHSTNRFAKPEEIVDTQRNLFQRHSFQRKAFDRQCFQPDQSTQPKDKAGNLSVLDHLPEPQREKHGWPSLLLEIREVLGRELAKHNLETQQLSLQLSLAIGQYLGGAQIYLPRGDALQRFIRDIEIWDAFHGNNTRQLARRYHLSEKAIYEIVARMRQLEQQRRQPDLFEYPQTT
jgi:Mor family transcriptional regulator